MKKISVLLTLFTFLFSSNAFSDQPKSIGKYKSWEAFTYNGSNGKICFAQTIPLDRAPKNLKRDENGFSWTPNVNLLMNSISEISAAVEVKNIDIKTLFIKGQKSSYILDSDIVELKKTFSNFGIIEIPNAGHWVHAENPSHFVTSVKEWI